MSTKIALVSDLHLDFADVSDTFFNERADVLVVAGDTCELNNYKWHSDFLNKCSDIFTCTIFVSGNHEGYGASFPKAHAVLKERLDFWGNLHYLEKDTFKFIKDDESVIEFFGCTMWTDMNKGDPVLKEAAYYVMNDYRQIHNSDENYRKISSKDTCTWHKESKTWLNKELKNSTADKKVVVTHYAPSHLSVHPRYMNKQDMLMNFYYYSDLSDIMLDHCVDVWCHGHVHNSFDYEVGNTRVLCNPRGYPHEGDYESYKPFIFEV